RVWNRLRSFANTTSCCQTIRRHTSALDPGGNVINRNIAPLLQRVKKSRLLPSAMVGVVLLLVAGPVGAADVAPTSFFGCLTTGGIINKITTDANNPPNCEGNSTAVS